MISTEHLIGTVAVILGSSFVVTGTRIAVDTAVPPAIEATWAAPDDVIAGDVIPVTWSFIKRTTCPGQNSRVWYGQDGFKLQEPLGDTKLPVSNDVATVRIDTGIPIYSPPGKLELFIEGWYQCAGQAKDFFRLGPVEMHVRWAEE